MNYLFGPFVGETIYELNYFVGHAIFLRKQNPKNKIIVLTREDNFDLYGNYATTLVKLPIGYEVVPYKFGCKNMRVNVFDEIVRRISFKYKDKFKIHDHFYPHISTYLADLKWYYPRKEVDFNFKPRNKNRFVAEDIATNCQNIILSDTVEKTCRYKQYVIFPISYFFEDATFLKNIDGASMLGTLIEFIRLCDCVVSDMDDLVGRLSILLRKPLITSREFIDAQYLNPINPYGSTVIGCQDWRDGLKYLEGLKNE